MPMTDGVDMQIRTLIAELMDAAPPAPTLSELEWRDSLQVQPQIQSSGRNRRPARLLAAVGGFAAVVLAALLVVVVLPSPGQHEPLAAAAELRLIAANAASQTPPRLGKGQWLSTEQRVSISGQVTQFGSTPTPDAQATIAATIEFWSDASGNACLSATSGTAQFATPTNESAWHAAGMVDTPTGEPITSCSSTDGSSSVNSLPGDSGVIDVSSLPTDPSTLEHELVTGTTGIAGLDQLSGGGSQNPGFERVAILLIGPTTGSSPTFDSALYSALALIPGIRGLGTMTTHTGATGIGFAGASALGTSVIIVDRSSGALLEAQNLESPRVYMSIGASYLAPPPTPNIGTEGGSSLITIQWLDPIGTPTVVPSSAVPDAKLLPKAVTLTGTITATAKLGVTYAELQTLENKLTAEYGPTDSEAYDAPSSVQDESNSTPITLPGGAIANIGAVVNWTFVGKGSQVSDYSAALRVSGLFSSVVVTKTA